MKAIYRTTATCLLLFTVYCAHAQSGGVGSWNNFSLKLNLTRHWSLFTEEQLRSQQFYQNFSYYELKVGAAFIIDKNYSVLIGGGRYVTYSTNGNFETPFTNKEWRIWEQFQMNSYLGRLKFEHRYRIEQRWTTALGYRNRFRYRINSVVPINHNKVEPGVFYGSAYDEIFLTNSNPHLERNRVFGGAGYQVSKHFNAQLGYLYQTDYRLNYTHLGKGYIQLSLNFEIDAHNEHMEKERPHSVGD